MTSNSNRSPITKTPRVLAFRQLLSWILFQCYFGSFSCGFNYESDSFHWKTLANSAFNAWINAFWLWSFLNIYAPLDSFIILPTKECVLWWIKSTHGPYTKHDVLCTKWSKPNLRWREYWIFVKRNAQLDKGCRTHFRLCATNFQLLIDPILRRICDAFLRRRRYLSWAGTVLIRLNSFVASWHYYIR